MKIAFIGFGEAARSFVDSLAPLHPGLIFAAHDIRRDDEMAAAMATRGVSDGGLAAALADARLVISAVTADQSLVAARAALPHLSQGQSYVDLNSVSPARKAQTAAEIAGRHEHYIDMAVMAPVQPDGHATPTLIAGETAEALLPVLTDLGFRCGLIGPTPGQAAGVKMSRSLFVKGLEAISVECAQAAASFGVLPQVLASLERSYPGLDLPRALPHMFERTLRHGTRRAAEMRECAATLETVGLAAGLAESIADVQGQMGALPMVDLPEGAFDEAVEAVATLRRTPT